MHDISGGIKSNLPTRSEKNAEYTAPPLMQKKGQSLWHWPQTITTVVESLLVYYVACYMTSRLTMEDFATLLH